tara:strand:- start:1840 stop:1989 length:150 start_codon:yes stop_codon:yes gene_type:complete
MGTIKVKDQDKETREFTGCGVTGEALILAIQELTRAIGALRISMGGRNG